MKIHIITDDVVQEQRLIDYALATQHMIDYLHIRLYDYDAAQLFNVTTKLMASGFPRQKLVIHDRIDVAIACGISTVQLGYRSMDVATVRNSFPQLTIIESVHSVEEANTSKADIVLFGHIFPTASKQNLPTRQLSDLTQIAKEMIVIGGIKPSNIHKLQSYNVAIMSTFWQSDEPITLIHNYKEGMGK
ncbi:thiamine phosphate synthase [Kurthia sibirica]|uniref:Thiamine phosphate synthase/TenI domain-containing protein n=1 Tax=Kurthia sibirica TaxID=202750 RepID=A0A2U3ALN4_9BACL|nr:thiamine phosphate synthase [Kurthia sibirica]PWI25419.1 hypothetical protein DEX24_08765 [Kurthia sibirica]GEK34345.1 thiamine phosphate synthase [Kurthia sibirica]